MPATSPHNPPTPPLPPDNTPPLPELEKFQRNLVQAMTAKNLSGSDVARAVWGSKTDARGRLVARNRDRMTHYMRGKSYPRPDIVTKLAQVLDLDPKDLEREAPGALPNGVTSLPVYRAAHHGAAARDTEPSAFTFDVKNFGQVDFPYNKRVDMRLAMRLFDAIRAVDPDFDPGPLPSDDDTPEG
jgi:transcriptional regulator with XRE-family HTH domain